MEGLPALAGVLEAGHEVAAVFTLADEQLGARSGPVDYGPLCERHGVPLHRIRNVNDEAAVALLAECALDYLFVIGWSQIVRPAAMATIRRGLIGAHASLLPHHRGSAPINWAVINGETSTGNTLIWLAEGVDAGDIIDQREFPIRPHDTCATLYERVAETNREMILELWPRLLQGAPPRRPQPPTDEPILARRRPEHGRIDWSQPARRIYDFVRALTRPYPGAFTELAGSRWSVWDAACLPDGVHGLRTEAGPGRILGPVHSPSAAASGLCVAAGEGAIVLLELQDADGRVLRGHELSSRDWAGQIFV